MNNFTDKVKEWVEYDNEIREYNEQIKQLKNEKNKLGDYILEYANENDMNKSTIHISDGKLKFAETKQVQPLTFQYINDCLHECIQDDDQIKHIIEYIKKNRKYTYTSNIKRVYISK